MTPEQNERAKVLFYRWCEAPDAERDRLVERLAGEDDAVRAEVQAMIELDESAGGPTDRFLEEPAFGHAVIGDVMDAARSACSGASSAPRALPEMIGHYRIRREIGMGGMGVVYEAEQDSPRRTVALKVIRPGVATPRTLRRFEFEAEVLGRLQHPGIAQIFEAGTFDDGSGARPFFAMELIRGRPLLAHAKECALDVRARLRLVARIARAVQHAHQHGIVHRDLKPENILVRCGDDDEGDASKGTDTTTGSGVVGDQPKVLDFGVARITGADVNVTTHATDVGQIVGTLAYMSPEQARGRRDEIDQRSDVYAIGVIAYELLAGRRPLDLGGMSLAEAVRTIEDSETGRLGAIDRGLRGDVETIVAKAMARDPDARYGSAAELAIDIERFLTDQPIVARPPSAAYHFRKFARRHRAVFTGAVVAVVALIIGFGATTVALLEALRSAEEARREQAVAAQVSAFLQSTLASVDPEAPTEARDLRELLDRAARRALDELAIPAVAQPVHLTIGRAYLSLAAFSEAERHLGRAHDLAIEAFGAGGVHEADVLESRGDLRLAQSELDEAETFYRRALSIRRSVAPGAPVGNSLNRLGECQKMQGAYAEGEASLREALRIHEAALGPDDLLVADDLHELGTLLLDTHDIEEAEPLVRRALAIRRRVLGDEHRQVSDSLGALGWLHRRAARHIESERYYREALAINRAILPEGHPGIAAMLERLAASIESQGRDDVAMAHYIEALDLQRASLGPRHADVGTTLNNIAGIHRRQGRHEDADRLYQDALSIYRERIGREHVWTSIVLWNIAYNHELAGDLAAAEPFVDECLRIRREYFTGRNEGRWQIAVVETLKAMCLADRDAFEDGETVLLSAIDVLRAECDDDDPRMIDAASRAKRFYERWGRSVEAERWAARAERSP